MLAISWMAPRPISYDTERHPLIESGNNDFTCRFGNGNDQSNYTQCRYCKRSNLTFYRLHEKGGVRLPFSLQNRLEFAIVSRIHPNCEKLCLHSANVSPALLVAPLYLGSCSELNNNRQNGKKPISVLTGKHKV